MKKITLLAVIPMSLLLAACGGEETKTFIYEEEGMSSEMVFTYSGDSVNNERSTTTLEYEPLGLSSAEAAEEVLADFTLDIQDVAGVEYNIDYGDSEAVETVEINYEEADINELREAGVQIEGEEDAEGISLEQTEEILVDQGYEAVEDEGSEE